jgi:hypothetical protein
VGAGLKKSLVPVFVGGGIDTKNDPRLVEAGALLELENLYMQRTGELRWRNGYTSLTKSQANGGSMTGISSIFKSQNGTTCVLASTSSGGPPSVRTLLQYDPVTPLWRTGNDANPMPTVNVSVSGMATAQYSTGVVSPVTSDLVRPDSAVAGNYLITCWTEAGGGGRCMYSVVNESTGAVVTSQTVIPGGGVVNGKKVRAVAGGSSFLCLVFSDNAGTPNLIISSINLATMAVTTTTIVAAGVAVAFPTPAVKSKPGSNNVIIAYAASGGGVSCMEVNPATNAIVTGPVNIAAVNVTMAMAWLDDQVPTGSYLLATAGAAAGVVTRVLTSAFAVSATNVIDAAATVNVNSVTGYVRTGVADYDVLWDVQFASASYNTIIRRGRWTGSVTLSDYARSFGIVSSAFKGPDGLWYLVASFSSTTQPTYLLLNTSASSTDPAPIASHCNLLNQSAGGANSGNSCPSSVSVTSSGRYLCALTKRAPPDGVNTHRQIVIARFAFSARPFRPRELGNTLFIPGGIQTRSDGLSASWSTLPIYPEAPTLTGAVTGGSLTLLGTYDYFCVYKRVDATGRVTRSAPSTPTTITLVGAQDTVNCQVPTLRVSPILSEAVTFEVYRRGPTASGASTINKVAEGINDPTVDTVSVGDGTADLTAAAGTLLYTTGGVLESFPPPSHNLLEVNATRVWVVNAEDPTELWPSKEYKPGVGIGFHPLLAFRVTGDGYGAITALAAMDGRLIVFKSGAIYVISGDGPDDNGRGSFNPPQAVSLSIGTVLPGSVVATPDGIMFQSSHGIYILTRGLALTYLGKPVEKYTLLENVVDASLVDNATQVRFVQASGRCLVWDYDLQRWYTFLLPVGASSIVACANISGGWCYGLADGTVKQEVSGQYSDDGVAIVPRITFPNMDTAGINGYQRVYAIQVLGEYLGDHTLTATIEYDYDGIAVPAGQKAITAGPYQYEIIPARKKCSAMKLTLSCTLLSGSGGFRLSGVSLLVGLKHGTSVPYTKRLT